MLSMFEDRAKKLRVAAFKGDIDAGKQSLSKETINKAGNESGKTALHFASQEGHLPFIAWLLENKALIDPQDKDHNTPLMLALLNKKFEAALALVKANSNLLLTNSAVLNAFQIAMSQGAPLELAQAIRTKLLAELGPNMHLTKEGYIQILSPGEMEQVTARLKKRTEPTKHVRLLPIVVSMNGQCDDWYAFLKEQLPHLRRLGYEAIGTEAPFDSTLICSTLQKSRFIWHSIGCRPEQRQDVSFRNTLPSLIKSQLEQHISDHDGGIVYILHSGVVDLQKLKRKLVGIPLAMYEYTDANDVSQQLEKMHLSENNHGGYYAQFWRPIQDYLWQHSRSTSCEPVVHSSLVARIKRVDHALTLVTDTNGVAYGLTEVQDLTAFNRLADRVERKLGLTPMLSKVNKKMSLRIPNLHRAKAFNTVYKKQQLDNEMGFEGLIYHWLLHQVEPDSQTLATENKAITKYTLSLPPERQIMTLQGFIKKIVYVELGEYVIDHQNDISSIDCTKGILDLTSLDNTHFLCVLSFEKDKDNDYAKNHSLRIALVTSLMERGASIDRSQEEHSKRFLISWDRAPCIAFYKDEATTFYQHLHQYLAKLLLEQLPKDVSGVDVFSFGCGIGEELCIIQDKLTAAKVPNVSMYGFDLNPDNFLFQRPGITFKQGNVMKLDTLVNSAGCNQQSYKIGLFIGLLVWGCMRGTYQALFVLQQARLMDKIYISGATPVLLNNTTLKAAGYHVRLSQFTTDLKEYATHGMQMDRRDWTASSFFELTPMSKEDRKHYLTERGISRSSNRIFDCLDLSMSANPLSDLMLFSTPSLESIKQVDISWAYFKQEEIQPFFKKLATLQKPLHLIVANQNLQNNEFIEVAKTYPMITLVERLDEKDIDEIPIFSPAEAKRYGLYKKLPNRSLR